MEIVKLGNYKYAFKYDDGHLSETFFKVYPYCDGFAPVQKEYKGPNFFLDENENLSEPFANVGLYHNGFARVQKKPDSNHVLRDMLGNLSKAPTKLGKDIFAFYVGDKTIEELCDKCFLDEKAIYEKDGNLYGFIADKLKRDCLKVVDSDASEKEKDNARFNYKEDSRTAYQRIKEAKEKKEEESKLYPY